MSFILYLLASILVILSALFVFLLLSARANKRWYDNPSSEGKFVDSHGKRIFFRVRGKGEPAVIVLGAMGGSQAEWWPIQNEIGMKYRMITLDRPGYGFSTAQESERTAARISEDLDTVLKFERIKKPVYLVAQGTGTLYARHYAATHPQNVAGVLFIDPLPLRYSKWLESINDIDECHNLSELAQKKKRKASKGLYRIIPPFIGYKLDRRYKRDIIEHCLKTGNYDTMQAEVSQIEASLAEIEAAGGFPSIPLKVLYPAGESLIRDWVKNGTSEYSARQRGRLHQELSGDILKLSTRSSIIEVEGSGEFIHLSKPDIVVREILKMMEE